jgi:hypothetical protein
MMTDSVTISSEDSLVIDGLRFAESVRNLDERSAMKVALALAGLSPKLFKQLMDVTKTQNIVPPSTLKLSPPAAIVTDKKEHQETLDSIIQAVKGE